VGLVGGSQAGWIIPVAASLSSRVSWAVILSGPTVSVGREIAYSDLVDVDHLSLEAAEDALQSYSGPEGFDPRPVLDRTSVPTLWLYGLLDESIPTRACLAVHAELQAKPSVRRADLPEPGSRARVGSLGRRLPVARFARDSLTLAAG
jgi:hypothetical protein